MSFKGEIALGALNTKYKYGFTVGDIYRIQGAGNLVPNNLAVTNGAFVEWTSDGWKVKKDMQYAVSKTGESLDQAVADVLDDHAAASVDEELTMPAAEAANYTVGNYFEQDGEIWKCTAKTDNGDGTWTVEAEKVNGVVPVLNELVSGANKQWTRRAVSLPIAPAGILQFDVQDHEFVDLDVQRSGAGNSISYVELHLYGECYIQLKKNSRVSVLSYIGDSDMTAIVVNTGRCVFDKDDVNALQPLGSGVPSEYDPDEFGTVYVLSNTSELTMETPVPSGVDADTMLLHFVGGMLIVTPLPSST